MEHSVLRQAEPSFCASLCLHPKHHANLVSGAGTELRAEAASTGMSSPEAMLHCMQWISTRSMDKAMYSHGR